jgi:hypothetical protein
MCSDSIQFRAIGAIKQPLIEWVNRPTFSRPTRSRATAPGNPANGAAPARTAGFFDCR